MNTNDRERNSQPLERTYFTLLGKKVQKSIYEDYIGYFIKFGKFTIVFAKTLKPKDYWWRNSPKDFPIHIGRKNMEVNIGIIKLIRFTCFRYIFDIGKLFN